MGWFWDKLLRKICTLSKALRFDELQKFWRVMAIR